MAVTHTELFMVRHGQTDSNLAGLFHGATDVPLNAIGLRQANLVAARIQLLEELRSLHSSPLQRALVTARAISATTGLEPRLHIGLAEMNFGEAEGATLSQMLDRWPELASRFEDIDDHGAGFPDGETRGEFHARVWNAIDDIATQHAGERILIVAHGGVIGSAVAQILGDNPNDWQSLSISNCSVTHIEMATTGPITHLLNDVIHLEEIDLEDTARVANT